jgi:hypothetical protein
MSNLRRLLAWLGTWGVVGIGVLIACATFYWSALKPAERDLAVQRLAAQNLKPRSPPQPVATDHRRDQLRAFQDLFPTSDKIPAEVERLWHLARSIKLELPAGEYRLETATPGLVRYHITFPVRGSYGQLRQFMDMLLLTVPTLSIDSLRFERKKVTETQIDARLQLTLYFRPAAMSQSQAGSDSQSR